MIFHGWCNFNIWRGKWETLLWKIHKQHDFLRLRNKTSRRSPKRNSATDVSILIKSHIPSLTSSGARWGKQIRQKTRTFRHTSIAGWFWRQVGSVLRREKQGDLISPIFPSGMRLRRIQGDYSLDIDTRISIRAFVVSWSMLLVFSSETYIKNNWIFWSYLYELSSFCIIAQIKGIWNIFLYLRWGFMFWGNFDFL